MMYEVAPESERAALLAKYSQIGGVLDFIFLEPDADGPPEQLHRAAALAGIMVIDRHLEEFAISQTSSEFLQSTFFRVHCDEAKLSGEQISFSRFWGSDDIEPKLITMTPNEAWSIPEVDGYKTAFFHPPHGLGPFASLVVDANEQMALFDRINKHILGDAPAQAEIFSWSTDWSNYFEAGLEWWGAFYWTIRPAGSRRFVVIGASATD